MPSKSIFTAANVPIIGGHHVLALQGSGDPALISLLGPAWLDAS